MSSKWPCNVSSLLIAFCRKLTARQNKRRHHLLVRTEDSSSVRRPSVSISELSITTAYRNFPRICSGEHFLLAIETLPPLCYDSARIRIQNLASFLRQGQSKERLSATLPLRWRARDLLSNL